MQVALFEEHLKAPTAASEYGCVSWIFHGFSHHNVFQGWCPSPSEKLAFVLPDWPEKKSHNFSWVVKNKTRVEDEPHTCRWGWTATFGALFRWKEGSRGCRTRVYRGKSWGGLEVLGPFQLFNTLWALIANSSCFLCAASMNRAVMEQGKSVWVTQMWQGLNWAS